MALIHIDDDRDERLADYRNVPDPELLHRRGLFVAEGRLVVRRLLERSRLAARSAMVTAAGLAAIDDLVPDRADVPVYLVPQRVMDAVTGFNIHRGCLAVGERPPGTSWEALTADAHRVVVLERVGNADNVGAVFRSAAAFGLDGVIAGPACADPLYRKAIRTSMGAALTLPFAAGRPWPGVLRALGEAGWMVTAMVTDRDAPAVRDLFASSAARRVAIVIGHEGDGVSAEARAACTCTARIPMTAGVDSLNAATAAAIAFYELGAAGR